MKTLRILWIGVLCVIFSGINTNEVLAQKTDTIHISKLELKRRGKQVFNTGNSVLVLHIDTLIMKDRSSLQFYDKKKVVLVVSHAEIGKRVYFNGRADKNNASDMVIAIKFDKLGSLFVMADGYDAANGFRTDPNGDGGNVKFTYSSDGIHPQQSDHKGSNYLHINVAAGGKHVNATADVQRIMDQIRRGGVRMGGLPQGQVYSGSAGTDGSSAVSSRPGDPRSW